MATLRQTMSSASCASSAGMLRVLQSGATVAMVARFSASWGSRAVDWPQSAEVSVGAGIVGAGMVEMDMRGTPQGGVGAAGARAPRPHGAVEGPPRYALRGPRPLGLTLSRPS